MNPTFPVGTRVKLTQPLGSLPVGSKGTVMQTFFLAEEEYCHVHFDAVSGPSTILVPDEMLAAA
jgi:hypothetical protein